MDISISQINGGSVYLIQMDGTDYYKIGMTTRDVVDRMSELQSFTPFALKVVDHHWQENPRDVEYSLHQALKSYRVRNEWFQCDTEIITHTFKCYNAMAIIDSALFEQKPPLNTIATNTPSPCNNTGILDVIDNHEASFLRQWHGEGLSIREMSRRLYFYRGGNNDNYSGDGRLFYQVRDFLQQS